MTSVEINYQEREGAERWALIFFFYLGGHPWKTCLPVALQSQDLMQTRPSVTLHKENRFPTFMVVCICAANPLPRASCWTFSNLPRPHENLLPDPSSQRDMSNVCLWVILPHSPRFLIPEEFTQASQWVGISSSLCWAVQSWAVQSVTLPARHTSGAVVRS